MTTPPIRLPPALAARDPGWPGLVWAYRMDDGAQAAEIHGPELETALNREAGWTWIHLDLVDNRVPAWINRVCNLPPAARMILEGREEDLVLGCDAGVVHGVCVDFQAELGDASAAVARLYFAVGERFIVTGRRRPLASIDAAHKAIAGGHAFATPYDLFGAIVRAFCSIANRHLARMSSRLDAVEDHVFDEAISNDRRELMAVRRLAVSVHRPIAGLVHLFDAEDMADWSLAPSAREMLRRLGLQLSALDRDVIMVSDRARLLYEEVVAQLADESNRSLRALALMSALLLPGSLTAGIFGMNVAGLPLLHSSGGFWVTLAIGAGATTGFYWILHRFGVSLKL